MLNHLLPEKERVKVSFGGTETSELDLLAACHPFIQQLDIVFLSNLSLLNNLEKIETVCGITKAALADVIKYSETFMNSVQSKSNLLLVSQNRYDDDCWCVDPRGHLTLLVSKETYERLGLVGRKLLFKGHEDSHYIDIPLKKEAHSQKNWSRILTALESWDERRRIELLGGSEDGALWDVRFCVPDSSSSVNPPFLSQKNRTHSVKSTKKELNDVHIPTLLQQDFQNCPPSNSEDVHEDWSRRLHTLFEWVGMVCLGAQRLYANDRVDPYIALYDPPAPNRVGDVVHLRWRGLVSSEFVKHVLDVIECVGYRSTLRDTHCPIPFVSVSAHSLTSSPVTYIPHGLSTESGRTTTKPLGNVPLKVPSGNGVDSWSILFHKSSTQSTENSALRWCLTEYLGQFDTRWG
ncbi:ribonuclease P 40kDa subunit-domain-containing protein [Crepidotus variabilis]|uniref:Ribonuclease P 40kDa subunit-domain-containing protein n=1 Tax=Crepidotus variabilis TaxID=179855 RepID=A0A9P6JSC1_9AGAR|nr:ribonuclease P 40kDa subunit-domain-containing protein [Crepidotus variabilis]